MTTKVWNVFEVKKIVSVVVIYTLDLLLLLLLLPFMIWEWISARDHVIAILRAILEVSLELIMWIIFAGVSILMTAVFIFDDINCSKTVAESQRRNLHAALPGNADKNSRILRSANLEEQPALKKKKIIKTS